MANRLPNGYNLPQPPCLPHREKNDWMEPGTEKQLFAIFAGTASDLSVTSLPGVLKEPCEDSSGRSFRHTTGCPHAERKVRISWPSLPAAIIPTWTEPRC